MIDAKRLRSNYINERNDNKRNKLNETTIDSNNEVTTSITHFEDFSNDIIYEIFDLLDFRHVHDAFSNVNIRFQNLLTNSTVPIKISMLSISKSDFKKSYNNILTPNVHRIKLLHLSNPFSIDLLFTHDYILSKLIRLETFILKDIAQEDVENLLTYLVTLPCLSSIIISCIDGGNIRNNLFHRISLLPVLKYCKILMNEPLRSESLLPIANNEFSSIEHLIINDDFDANYLNAVLSYVPHLRRLSCGTLFQSSDIQMKSCSIKLNHLTHASLCIHHLTFDQFETLTKSLFLQLQVLYITTYIDPTYLNANRWEQLILSYMPHLRIFNILCDMYIHKDDYSTDILMIEQFRSHFWLERQWFFTSTIAIVPSGHYRIFLSTIPYRRKFYSLYENSNNDIISNCQKHNIDSVHHVLFHLEQRKNDYRNYFPNATELTLCCDVDNTGWNPSSIVLNDIFPLAQLTKLSFNIVQFSFDAMIKVLSSTPNIQTLAVAYVYIDKKHLASIQQTETFQSVSNTNNIKNLTLWSIYRSEEIKLFIRLCPRLEELTLYSPNDDYKGTLQYLLMKDNPNIQHLFFLHVAHASEEVAEITKTVAESQETIDDYVMKKVQGFMPNNIYLRW